MTLKEWQRKNVPGARKEDSISVVPFGGGDGRPYMVVSALKYDRLLSEEHATQLVTAGDPTVADYVAGFEPEVLGELDPEALPLLVRTLKAPRRRRTSRLEFLIGLIGSVRRREIPPPDTADISRSQRRVM